MNTHTLICILAITAACSSKATVECGEGTGLVDGKCVAATPVAPPAPAPHPVDAEARQRGWSYSTNIDKMRETSSEMATLESAPMGGATLRLTVGMGGLDSILVAGASLDDGPLRCGEVCVLNVRFDDGPVEKVRARPGEKGIVLAYQPQALIQQLRNASTAIVEVETAEGSSSFRSRM